MTQTQPNDQPDQSPPDDYDSGVQDGEIEETAEGFVVNHEDGTSSSYIIHNEGEPVPSSVDEINAWKAEDEPPEWAEQPEEPEAPEEPPTEPEQPPTEPPPEEPAPEPLQ